jgi:hypothetical protein
MKQQIKNHIDMPDQSLDLFIKCVRLNNGKLSARKREQHFSMLTNEEIHLLEQIINRVSSHTENVI